MKKLLLTLLLAAAAMPGWADEYYLVGGCTENNWANPPSEYNRSTVRAYSGDGTNWAWAGYISRTTSGDDGRFKIPNSATGWDGFWAPEQDKLITAEGVDLSTNSSGDNKFRLAETGYYLIKFNTDTKKIYANKLTEPSKDGDYFLISSLDDYYYFAAYIATAETKNAKARLTADLSFEGKTFVPLASDKFKFSGEFDGNGHTIDYAIVTGSYKSIGLFAYVTGGANIHDLVMGEHSSFTASVKAGGIAGYARDGGTVTLTNIINRANVTSTAGSDGNEGNTAGLIACAVDGTKITATNCANMGTVHGQEGQCAAFAGWTQPGTTFINCWNIGEINNIDSSAQLYRNSGAVSPSNCYDLTSTGNQGTKLDASTQGSGELCFRLNGDQNTIAWYQTIGTDGYPVPFSAGHSQVYATGSVRCDGYLLGDNSFTNSGAEASIPSHSFDGGNGWCTVCGTLDEDYLAADGEGFYSIGTANDLYWFAQVVNTVNQSAKAKLTADINYTVYKQGWIGASQGKAFSGTFDGQEHTLTIDIVNTDLGQTGLFAYINAATIKNLIVEGSATSAGNNCVGGLGGRGDGSTSYIQNVIVKTNVSFTGTNGNKDATCGGLFASIHGTAEITNCAFLGSITVPDGYQGNGGLVGWAGSGNNNKYTNCLVAPTAYNKTGNSEDYARNNPKVTNCFFTSANDAKLASGELCYQLNGDQSTIGWYQNLSGSVDAYPVPFSTHSQVYANGSFNCDGTPKGTIDYGNTDDEHHDSHTLGADGFCSVCSAWMSYVSSFMTPAADGYYEIANNKQMRWFAAMIKDYRNAYSISSNEDANAPVNARLMNDIDFTGIKDFEPIGGLWGQGSTRYAGTFDGQHHKITNLVVDLDKDNVGVFGVIAEGAVIKNFTLDATCSITGNGHVGIVGEIWRSHNGEVHLECLGNEANITGNGNNVGGILGVNMNNSGYAKLYMTNCYSTGAIRGASENGQLTGWGGDGAVVKNCYANGETANAEGFGRFPNGCTITNCFSDKNLDWGPTQITGDMLTDGTLCAKLGFAFRQTIGSGHPCFDQEKGFVAQIGSTGYSTMYNTYSDVTIPSGVKAYAGEVRGEVLSLIEIEDKIKAGEPVVLAGEGLYNFMPTTGASEAATNELLGSDGSVTGGAGIYALAKKGEPAAVGFYLVGSGVTIPEGKAYISSGAGIKGFVFEFDDATSIEEAFSNSPLMSENIYNLAGQRIQKMQKGINIVNGKKVLK